jgi:G3E family GTPase
MSLAADAERDAVPVLLVAGAFGAGKTSLLARWMAEPAFASAAVLVNELGEACVDTPLLRGASPAALALSGGCACCGARQALAASLEALAGRHRANAPFDRVAVELAGLAQPRALLEDFTRDARLRERFPLHGLATVVDANAGIGALAAASTRAQLAAADVIVLARSEHCAPEEWRRFAEAARRVNPHAELVRGDAEAAEVWHAAGAASGRELRYLEAALGADAPHGVEERAHHEDIGVHTLGLGEPVELSAYCLRLAAFLDAHREAVLRVKGLVGVQGRHGPAVIQAVRGELQPVRTLGQWPAGAVSALVVVARGLDAAAISSALS